jgi:hypothetical protein
MGNITSIDFQSPTIVTINSTTPITITNATCYLDVNIMDNNTTIINSTSPQIPVIVKLWADFINNIPQNIPSGQFIIDGSNITLDGQGLELDLSYNSVDGYEGLVHVNDGSQGINIQNINAIIGSGYNLSSSTGNIGWICQGSMNNVEISFNNCSVTSPSNIIISNQGNGTNGGICGGSNGINGNFSLSFTNSSVTSINGSITINNQSTNGLNGGICGGFNKNIETLSFTGCSVTSLSDIIINTQVNSSGNGGICGGFNGFTGTNITFTITGSSLRSINGSIITQNGIYNGGICGGNNRSIEFFTITDCSVKSSTDIIISNQVNPGNVGFNGGICGGSNITIVNFIIRGCSLTSLSDIVISNQGNLGSNGGICGGSNGSIGTLTITGCSVTSTNGSISDNQFLSVNGCICGGNNSNITNVNFTDCLVTSNNNITSTTSNNNIFGGICGGQNIGNYTFTNCNIKSLNGSLSITKTGMLVFNNFGGGICGGQNTGVFNFIECKVETENNITITSINHTNWGGGICGGRNNETQTLNSTFTNCQVNSLAGDIIINGSIANNGGGICGAETKSGTLLNSTYTFNLCFVNPFLNFIYSGVTISKPNSDRTTLKNKIMIGASNLPSIDSNILVDCVSQLLDNPVYVCNTPAPTPSPTPTPTPLGGGTQGVSLKVLHLMEGGNSRAMTRRVLRSAFGNENNTNNKTRKCKTPFRIAVNEQCGTEKAPIIYSGADYIRFKKLKAENQTYNDKSYGGDNSHGSYVSLKRARN